MDRKRAVVKKISGVTFAAKGGTNHWVVMDGPAAFGGQEAASRPVEFFLFALGGCTASDVASILDKMRMEVTDFQVHLSAEAREEHPKSFRTIDIEYVVTGRNIDRRQVEHAIELSATKYCSVRAMLHPDIVVTHKCTINELNTVNEETDAEKYEVTQVSGGSS